MKDSDAPGFPDGPDIQDVRRLISRNLPENMGILELLLIDEWLSQTMQSGLYKLKSPRDLKQLRDELEKRLLVQKERSR